MSKKIENAINLYEEGILQGNCVESVNKYTGDSYTQHSTGVKDGKEGFIEFFTEFIERNPVRDIQIIRKIVDGQNVFLHAYQDINNGEAKWVTTDFFDTDNNDKIIEHWDVIAAYTGENMSGHTQIDGETEVKDLENTEDNKQLIRNLLKDAFMKDGNPNNLNQYISRKQYIQHNNEEDGLEAFEKLAQMPNRQLNYQEIVLLVGQGNFVASLCKATYTKGDSEQALAQVDVFRIEDGLIVEHWDNWETVPEENVNSGKF